MSLLLIWATMQAAWQIERSVDPITDDGMVMARLSGENGEIHVGCQSFRNVRLYSVIFQTRRHLGDAQRREIVFRFDQRRADYVIGTYADTMAATATLEDASTIMRGMRSASLMRVRLTDYRGGSWDMSFTVGSAAAVLDRLDRECETAVRQNR